MPKLNHSKVQRKLDNTALKAKVALRAHFLERFHRENPPAVFDCCQGEGLIWNELRERFTLGEYFGVDMKKSRGRLAINSVKLLQDSSADVVDVDVYGSPWKHYFSFVSSTPRPCSLFLTFGHGGGNGYVDHAYRTLLGLGEVLIPDAVLGAFGYGNLGIRLGLESAYEKGWAITYGMKANTKGPNTYLGLRFEPLND